MSQPECQVCHRSGHGVQFPMTGIKTAGFKFGEICDVCDVGDDVDRCGCALSEPIEACPTHQLQYKKVRTT